MRARPILKSLPLLVLLAGCNVDIVLPVENVQADDRVVTVVDLNGRTQHVAIVDGVEQR